MLFTEINAAAAAAAIMTLISPGDCTLQNVQSTSFCTSLRNFIQIGPLSAKNNDVMSIFKKADLTHLGF